MGHSDPRDPRSLSPIPSGSSQDQLGQTGNSIRQVELNVLLGTEPRKLRSMGSAGGRKDELALPHKWNLGEAPGIQILHGSAAARLGKCADVKSQTKALIKAQGD